MVRSSAVTLEDIACPENLLRALERSLRGTKRTPAVERICRKMSRELAELRRQILSEQLQLGRATEFLIFDPKPRRVSAPIFVERVLHHAVMAHVGPVLERSLVADTFACLRGRGTLAAVLRAQQHSRRFSWYGQLDIRQYFASVQHEALLTLLFRRFRNAGVRRLLEQIVRSGLPGPAGLPIGSLCSQHFANAFLGVLDHQLLQHKSVRGLVRYMDDVVFWADDRQQIDAGLQLAHDVITEQLHLGVRDEPVVNRVGHGLSFCGYRIFPGILRVLPRRKQRFILARKKWEARFAAGLITDLELQRGYDAAAGILAHADTREWRRRQLRLSPPNAACELY
jgi:RNA-directed DNA polymerase